MSTRTLETASFDILYKPSRTHIPVGINPILIVRALLPLLLAVDRVLFIPCLERTFLLVWFRFLQVHYTTEPLIHMRPRVPVSVRPGLASHNIANESFSLVQNLNSCWCKFISDVWQTKKAHQMVGPISFVCVLIEHCSKINQLVQAILMSIDCPFTQRDCGCRAFNQIIEDDFAVIVGGLCSAVCFQQGFVSRGNAERPGL